MDIYLESGLKEIKKIFSSLGFEIKDKKGHLSAILRKKRGRYHALLKEHDDKVYCDFHWDNKKHFLFWSVDYWVMPFIYFEKKIKTRLETLKVEYTFKKVNWFTRKNKSVFHGITFKIFTWKMLIGFTALFFLSRFL